MPSQKAACSKLAVVLVAGLSAQGAFSGSMGDAAPAPRFNYVTTLSVGPVWQSSGKTQTFYLAPEIEKTYAASNKSSA